MRNRLGDTYWRIQIEDAIQISIALEMYGSALIKAPAPGQLSNIGQFQEYTSQSELDHAVGAEGVDGIPLQPMFLRQTYLAPWIFLATLKALNLYKNNDGIRSSDSIFNYPWLDYLIRCHRDADEESVYDVLQEALEFCKDKSCLFSERLAYIPSTDNDYNFYSLDIALQISHISMVELIVAQMKKPQNQSEALTSYPFFAVLNTYADFLLGDQPKKTDDGRLKTICEATIEECVEKISKMLQVKISKDSKVTTKPVDCTLIQNILNRLTSVPEMKVFLSSFLDKLSGIKMDSATIFLAIIRIVSENADISYQDQLDFKRKLSKNYRSEVAKISDDLSETVQFIQDVGQRENQRVSKFLTIYEKELLNYSSDFSYQKLKRHLQLFIIALSSCNFEVIKLLIYGCAKDKFREKIPTFIDILDPAGEKYKEIKNFLISFDINQENLDHYIQLRDYIFLLKQKMGDEGTAEYETKKVKKEFCEKILEIYTILAKSGENLNQLNLADILYTIVQQLKEKSEGFAMAQGIEVDFSQFSYPKLVQGFFQANLAKLIDRIIEKSPKAFLESCERQLYKIIGMNLEQKNTSFGFHHQKPSMHMHTHEFDCLQKILELHQDYRGILTFQAISGFVVDAKKDYEDGKKGESALRKFSLLNSQLETMQVLNRLNTGK